MNENSLSFLNTAPVPPSQGKEGRSEDVQTTLPRSDGVQTVEDIVARVNFLDFRRIGQQQLP
jgi:hypothetical protein